MTELKTQKNDGDVEAFCSVENKRRREDSLSSSTDARSDRRAGRAVGTSIIGFGTYHWLSMPAARR